MHEALAFVRQDVLTNASYRTRALFSTVGLVTALIPLYFVAGALQPVMAPAIESQGGDYFAFLVVGTIALKWVIASLNTLPGAFLSGVRSGTLESIFVTPVRLPVLVTGMLGYRMLWTVAESIVVVMAGVLLGANFIGKGVPVAILILSLVAIAYAALGMIGAALMLLYRTTGPLLNLVLVGSTLLGGVYYPTHVIPSWIENVSAVVPLTYGLRALRRTLLEGLPVNAVSTDLGVLAALAGGLLAVGLFVLDRAVRHARRTGTLAQY